jgi:hypothetical protein
MITGCIRPERIDLGSVGRHTDDLSACFTEIFFASQVVQANSHAHPNLTSTESHRSDRWTRSLRCVLVVGEVPLSIDDGLVVVDQYGSVTPYQVLDAGHGGGHLPEHDRFLVIANPAKPGNDGAARRMLQQQRQAGQRDSVLREHNDIGAVLGGVGQYLLKAERHCLGDYLLDHPVDVWCIRGRCK